MLSHHVATRCTYKGSVASEKKISFFVGSRAKSQLQTPYLEDHGSGKDSPDSKLQSELSNWP